MNILLFSKPFTANLPYFDEEKELVDVSTIVKTLTTEECSLEEFVKWCYPELQRDTPDIIATSEKGMLCPLNEDVDTINNIALQLMEGHCNECLSADVVHDETENPIAPEARSQQFNSTGYSRSHSMPQNRMPSYTFKKFRSY